MNKEGIFKVSGDQKKIEEYKIHLEVGDFSIFKQCLPSEQFPSQHRVHEVANILKDIVRNFEDPVCPFDRFLDFRNITSFETQPILDLLL